MAPQFLFLINSSLLGIALATDAFSVSIANGLKEPEIHLIKAGKMALTFALFQAFMPLIGWGLTNAIIQRFASLQQFIPCTSLLLLSFIGLKFIHDSYNVNSTYTPTKGVTNISLIIQGIATSLDALSVGLALADYSLGKIILCSLIIAGITYAMCFIGVIIGKKIGQTLSGRVQQLGGIIMILIGIEIYVRSL